MPPPGEGSFQRKLLDSTHSAIALRAEHVWLDGAPLAVLQGGQAYHVHPDRPRLITDAAGIPVWRWDGDPFGATPADEDPDGDGAPFVYNLRFPGQYFDAETGLHYNMARYYDPATGQYRESDPIGLRGGVNTYGYVGGNPVNWTDPFGLYTLEGDCGCNDEVIKKQIDEVCSKIDTYIKEPAMASCLKERCMTGKAKCGGRVCPYAGWQNDLWGKDRAFICTTNEKQRWGDVAIHEWGHSCGWQGNHPDVPGWNFPRYTDDNSSWLVK